MDPFWQGFVKEAEQQDIFQVWAQQASEKPPKKKEFRVDPIEASEDHGPDAAIRYW